MNRNHSIACAMLILLASAAGCCCGRYNQCQGPGCPPPTGVTGFGNARIAPPGTNSYQIQSAGQPYYSPTATAGNPNVFPPVAPTVAAGSAGSVFNPTSLPTLQPGWRPADAPVGSGFYGPTSQPNGTAVSPTSFQPVANDYRSTMVDERFDPTRMPANDATMVRAPSNFNPTGNWQMINPVAVNNSGSYEYRTSPQISGLGAASQIQSLPQPTIGYPSYPAATQAPAVVLAQASTSPEVLARDPNYQAGWRDRFATGTYMNR